MGKKRRRQRGVLKREEEQHYPPIPPPPSPCLVVCSPPPPLFGGGEDRNRTPLPQIIIAFLYDDGAERERKKDWVVQLHVSGVSIRFSRDAFFFFTEIPQDKSEEA